MNSIHRWLIPTVAAGLAMGLGAGCVSLGSPDDAKEVNTLILSAAMPLRTLAAGAVADDPDAMSAGMKAFQARADEAGKVLSYRVRWQLADLVNDARKARAPTGSSSTGTYAADAYRTLVERLNPRAMTFPREVLLLDYVGLKLQALVDTVAPDWGSVQDTAAAAGRYWGAVRPQVANEKLQRDADTAVRGMNEAAAAQNTEMTKVAAQALLTLVDPLKTALRQPLTPPRRKPE